MPSLFTYFMTTDVGDAPCHYRGTTTLCTCKPAIRRSARVGDLVVALVGTQLSRVRNTHDVGDLLWMGRVAGIMSMGEYGRRHGGRPDAIYRINGEDGIVKQVSNPWHDATHVTQDLSGRRVLFFADVQRFSRTRIDGKWALAGCSLQKGHVRTRVPDKLVAQILTKHRPVADKATRRKSVLLGSKHVRTMRFLFGPRAGPAPKKAPKRVAGGGGVQKGGNCGPVPNAPHAPQPNQVAQADEPVPEEDAGNAAEGEVNEGGDVDQGPDPDLGDVDDAQNDEPQHPGEAGQEDVILDAVEQEVVADPHPAAVPPIDNLVPANQAPPRRSARPPQPRPVRFRD